MQECKQMCLGLWVRTTTDDRPARCAQQWLYVCKDAARRQTGAVLLSRALLCLTTDVLLVPHGCRMRIKMGLKPLTADGGSKGREDKERAAGKERRDAEAKKASEAELRQRISRRELLICICNLPFQRGIANTYTDKHETTQTSIRCGQRQWRRASYHICKFSGCMLHREMPQPPATCHVVLLWSAAAQRRSARWRRTWRRRRP